MMYVRTHRNGVTQVFLEPDKTVLRRVNRAVSSAFFFMDGNAVMMCRNGYVLKVPTHTWVTVSV